MSVAASEIHDAMLTASPDPREDAELVERLAVVISRNCVGVENCKAIARAILEELSGGK